MPKAMRQDKIFGGARRDTNYSALMALTPSSTDQFKKLAAVAERDEAAKASGRCSDSRPRTPNNADASLTSPTGNTRCGGGCALDCSLDRLHPSLRGQGHCGDQKRREK